MESYTQPPALTSYSSAPQEEALPSYDQHTPQYDPQAFHTPILTYHFRQTKTNLQIIVPFGPAPNTPSYEAAYRSSTSLPIFSRKAKQMEEQPGRNNQGGTTREERIVRMDFHSEGDLPWYPRARFRIKVERDGEEKSQSVEMQAKDFRNWTVNMNEETYIWKLREIPCCLELSALHPYAPSSVSDTTPITARFMYGKVGTNVLNGGEIGKLEIFREGLTEKRDGLESVICGCCVVVQYFKGLGRKYRNDGSGGSGAASLVNPKGQMMSSVKGGLAYI
ncbi:hypothetical protein K469DRAFT_663268 [Zopfia rhizophila CBS 207.26]|uniref:Uncharacterized protein n=1 Tax=Zopfia rhizophila CBS 207.26 TaxID=1314779 RepID=A0A6A6E9J8_9PEZI|nr:hypothetical protein K469DRAFT_663268 [Zopfia rhizophila CBS 207.26]